MNVFLYKNGTFIKKGRGGRSGMSGPRFSDPPGEGSCKRNEVLQVRWDEQVPWRLVGAVTSRPCKTSQPTIGIYFN